MRLQEFKPDHESLDSLAGALRFCLSTGGDPSEICHELVDRLRMSEEREDGLISRVARLEEDVSNADATVDDLNLQVDRLLAGNAALKQDVDRLRKLEGHVNIIAQHRSMCERILRFLPVPTQEEYELYALKGKKIDMIKEYRARTDRTLLDCKLACDAHIFLKEA